MKKYFLLAAVILVFGLLVNYSLGGFKDVDPVLIDVDNYTVYGKSYEGSYKNSWLKNMVDEMRNLQDSLETDTDLVIINYNNEAKETIGDIHNFIGLSPKNSVKDKALEEFEKRVITASKAIQLKVKIQPLVMPSPEKMKETALEFANTKGLKLQELSIEKYRADGVLIIEFPVK